MVGKHFKQKKKQLFFDKVSKLPFVQFIKAPYQISLVSEKKMFKLWKPSDLGPRS